MTDDITGVRILVIDDSSTHLAVCRKLLLTAGVDPYYIYEAQSIKQAKKVIKDTPPDICFIDYVLPDGFGSEILNYIQAYNQEREPSKHQIISVVMTGAGNEKLVASLFRCGASDYLMKHDFIDRFIPAVKRAVQFRLDSIRKTEQSLFDPITSTLNRSAFIERANLILMDHYSKKQICALIFIDLDDFKSVNDNYGHTAGDAYLKAVSKRIQELCRSTDLAGRFGGDEFVVLLRDISKCDLILKVDQWMKNNALLKHEAFQQLEFKCSVGVAISNQKEYASLDEFISAADSAMYSAKKNGKNKYAFVGTNYLIKSNEKDLYFDEQGEVSSSLFFLKALLNNEFKLCFQPIRDVNTLEIQMFEVLVRWPDMPQDMSVESIFHGLSRFDLYDQFHEWLIPSLMSILNKWNGEGCVKAFALNAPDTIKGCDSLLKNLKKVMQPFGNHIFNSVCFNVEMSETLLNYDFNYVEFFQKELQKINIQTSLDQFSRSETNLVNLAHAKFSQMKIRRCDFNHGFDNEYEKVLKLSSFLRLSLGCNLVAVGVESLHDFERVKAAGVDKVQGYFVGKPLIADKPWDQFISQYSSLKELINK